MKLVQINLNVVEEKDGVHHLRSERCRCIRYGLGMKAIQDGRHLDEIRRAKIVIALQVRLNALDQNTDIVKLIRLYTHI